MAGRTSSKSGGQGPVAYLALLRGVNVGGANRVEMARLRAVTEGLGFDDVRTYINSGNLLFRTASTDRAALTDRLEFAIEAEFGFRVPLLLWTANELARLVASLPKDCADDANTRCNVLFLWPEADKPEAIDGLPVNPEVDRVQYLPGAVVWQLDRAKATRSRLNKLVGTPFYRQISIRNSNTVRKLHALLQ